MLKEIKKLLKDISKMNKDKTEQDDYKCPDCYKIDPTGKIDCPRHRK